MPKRKLSGLLEVDRPRRAVAAATVTAAAYLAAL